MLQTKRSHWGKKAGFDIGDILHIATNLIFVGLVYLTVVKWNLLVLAIALMLISKWRILAVQPRFWWPNIKTNLVDITVGLGTIALLHQVGQTVVSWLILLQFAAWLIYIKPKDSEGWMSLQAAYSHTFGLVSVMAVQSIVKLPLLVCLLVWVITWASARHFFGSHEEPHYRLLSLTWALLCIYFIWVSLHWLQYYQLGALKLSAAAIFVSVIAITTGAIYRLHQKKELKKSVLVENLAVGLTICAVIIVTAGWRI